MSDLQVMNALLVKLEHTTGLELSDTIDELLGLSAPVDRIASIVERRVDEGVYVISKTLATLLAQSHSQTLYEKSRNKLKDDVWALLILYEGRYPDVEIEQVLIKKLYSVASDDGEPRRRYIVNAMKQVASEAVLPTLQAIAHNLQPGAKIGKLFGDALGLEGRLAAQSRWSFLQDVLVAIDAVEQRAKSRPSGGGPTTATDETNPEFDDASNAQRFKVEANKFVGVAPGIVVHFVRKGAEALAKDLYRHLGLEKGGRPAKRMMLEELISHLKQAKKANAPDLLQIFLQTFQTFGYFASHDQDGDETCLTNDIAEPIYKLYCQALILYANWRKEPQREQGNTE